MSAIPTPATLPTRLRKFAEELDPLQDTYDLEALMLREAANTLEARERELVTFRAALNAALDNAIQDRSALAEARQAQEAAEENERRTYANSVELTKYLEQAGERLAALTVERAMDRSRELLAALAPTEGPPR